MTEHRRLGIGSWWASGYAGESATFVYYVRTPDRVAETVRPLGWVVR